MRLFGQKKDDHLSCNERRERVERGPEHTSKATYGERGVGPATVVPT